jgi:hypothetical protein
MDPFRLKMVYIIGKWHGMFKNSQMKNFTKIDVLFNLFLKKGQNNST